jgi:hypothetical protein
LTDTPPRPPRDSHLRDRLDRRQLGWIVAALLLLPVVSYVGWRLNDHPQVRAAFPHWVIDGHLMFDGYGDYALALRDALSGRGPDGGLRSFASQFLHADRLVYPLAILACALPVGGSIPFGAAIASTIFSLLAFAMFARIAAEWFDLRGRDLFWLLALFLSHVAVIGAWSRGMADSAALCILLAILYWSERAARTRTVGAFAILAALLALGALTKTILILAIPLPILALLLMLARTPAQIAAWGSLCAVGPFAALAAVQLGLRWLGGGESANARFLSDAISSVFTRGSEWFRYAAVAGGLMIGLAVQVWPFLAFASREPDAPPSHRFGWRDPRWMLPLAWIALYLAQRFAFSGYALHHSRARYGLPLVPCAMLLAWPGVVALARRHAWARWTPAAMVAANLALFVVFHLRQVG